ncbi:MAG TPA: cytochrome c oxidase subunit 3 [Stellaceae bacterium]|nr:cytochrome c oxidase subunit 3 [Stellaceae bacterium]
MTASPFLRPPWDNLNRQHQAVSLGMWIFLVSEILLFAGLFAGYGVYRHLYPASFAKASAQTDIVFGTVNTAILMTSSLSIALAGGLARARLPRLAWYCLLATLVLGAAFLVVKGFEYREDIDKHLFPGPQFALGGTGPALFFSFYWIMTGVHAAHVSGGLAAIARLLIASRNEPAWLSGGGSEEATALYWHLVDVIWIVLYPLLYLNGRTHG